LTDRSAALGISEHTNTDLALRGGSGSRNDL
jgi:hypothetical protein